MPAADPTVNYDPELEYRRSFLLLRWLLIILAAYLTLFSHIQAQLFTWVCVFVTAFALSNIVCMLLSRDLFKSNFVQTAVLGADILFVSIGLQFLRVQTTYLHLAFVLMFFLIAIWRDLKVVAFSVVSVSLLYGVFSSLELVGMFDGPPGLTVAALALGEDTEGFLRLSLFFVVAIFYLFLSEQFSKHSRLSAFSLEENRRTEVMAEITRSISSSLNSEEILYLIVTRLREVFGATDCSIVRLNPGTKRGQVLSRATEPRVKDLSIDLEEYPEVQRASELRELLYMPEASRDGVTQSVVAVPMLAKDSSLGVIHVRFERRRGPLMSRSDERFFKVMSMTAATALRNAELFEEMSHRARTDFLTDLPNHRFFQFTLSAELERTQRHNHSLSLLIIDLDFLKGVNDRYGHPTGDLAIRMTGEVIRSNCRDFDFAARYGGEEFVVILPETPLTGAIEMAERIRSRIADAPFPGIGSITASIGVANYPVNALCKEDLIRVADQALYVAKANGRDRVEYFSSPLLAR